MQNAGLNGLKKNFWGAGRDEPKKRPWSPGNYGVYLFAIIWAVIALYPIFFCLECSFKNTTEIYTGPFQFPHVFRYQNYLNALFSAGIIRCLFNSTFIAGIAVLALIVTGSMASYILTRTKYKCNNFIYIYFLAGLMIPIHSTFIPLVRMAALFKAFDNYLTMIVIYVAFNLSITIFLITGYMKGISKELDEAALIDGCGHFGTFFKIIMPISMPAIATAAIISFLAIYNELIFAVLFINRQELRTVSLGLLQFSSQHSTDHGPRFAAIIVAIIPMILFFLAFREKIITGLSAGAVKG